MVTAAAIDWRGARVYTSRMRVALLLLVAASVRAGAQGARAQPAGLAQPEAPCAQPQDAGAVNAPTPCPRLNAASRLSDAGADISALRPEDTKALKEVLDKTFDSSGDKPELSIPAGMFHASAQDPVAAARPAAPALKGALPELPAPAATRTRPQGIPSGWVYAGLGVVIAGAAVGAFVIGTPIAVGVAGVVGTVALITGAVYHHADSENKVWSASKSQGEIETVDVANRAAAAESLHNIRAAAAARRGRMLARIADAERRGAKTVDDKTHDSLKRARAYAGYDSLVVARAALQENVVSADAAQRAGGQLPAHWSESVAALEGEAARTGKEGALARELKALSAEIAQENVTAGQLQGDIQRFEKTVPGMFGGQLKDQAAKANAELQRFRDMEIAPETALHARANGAMRGRVSDRIYGERDEFKKRRDRFDRLSALSGGPLKSATELAHKVDSDLSTMASARATEAAMLVLAAANEHVAVEHCETVTDSKGDSHQDCHTEYEDHSFVYKAAASAAATSAQGAARDAQGGIDALKSAVPALAAHPVIQAEGLSAALPTAFGSSVDAGHGVFFDMFLPAWGSLIASGFNESSATSVRAKFAPVMGAIDSVKATVKSRQDGEDRWVNGQIDSDLTRQMDEAGAR